jgi:hypothetical protein
VIRWHREVVVGFASPGVSDLGGGRFQLCGGVCERDIVVHNCIIASGSDSVSHHVPASSESLSAITASRSAAAIWYRIAIPGVVCPIRFISSFVVAPA